MVHYWGPLIHVRSRAVAVVDEGGTFINYYVHMTPVKSLQMLHKAVLNGANSQAYLTAILVASKEALLDVGRR